MTLSNCVPQAAWGFRWPVAIADEIRLCRPKRKWFTEKAFVSSSEENLSSEMITRLAWVVNVEDVFGPHTRTHACARTYSSGSANTDVTAFNRRPRPAHINDTGHQGRQRFLVFALQALWVYSVPRCFIRGSSFTPVVGTLTCACNFLNKSCTWPS